MLFRPALTCERGVLFVTVQPIVKLGRGGMPMQGFHPCTPPETFFENLLAPLHEGARCEFAFGKYREGFWTSKNLKKDIFGNIL